jgi:ankyrin repeat protein
VLHLTASDGHGEMVRALLEKGAAIEPRDKNGRTALYRAHPNGHRAAVRTLKKQGASEYRDGGREGKSALHQVASDGRC